MVIFIKNILKKPKLLKSIDEELDIDEKDCKIILNKEK